MVLRKKDGALTKDERKIVKALLLKGGRNQDIQALLNIGRVATVNSARITEVKADKNQKPATDDEVKYFEIKKNSYDAQTGLNLFEDERLIRAREAMILAVQVFNSASLKFKTEVFTMLANVAWTYLLHEYYIRKNVKIIGNDGRSLLLSQMLERHDCPLSRGIVDNLKSIKLLRDEVEHKLLGKADFRWLTIFQANCLNFDKALCGLFGSRLTLANDLSFALQFSKLNIEQISELNKHEIPAHIDALDARLISGMTEEQINDLEYQFRVIYTLDATTKSNSHIEFVRPETSEGKDIRNVLVNYKSTDNLYPLKPSIVIKQVSEKSGVVFSSHNHTQAWKIFNARPKSGDKSPENTNKEYCIFHKAHRDYTYSDKWVLHLVNVVGDAEKFAELKSYKL